LFALKTLPAAENSPENLVLSLWHSGKFSIGIGTAAHSFNVELGAILQKYHDMELHSH